MQQDQEREIAELKQLVEKDIEIGDETRRMVHQMRRSARWSLAFQIFYWFVILGVLGASYYYVSPYVGQVFGFYRQFSTGGSASSSTLMQDIEQGIGKYFVGQASTTNK